MLRSLGWTSDDPERSHQVTKFIGGDVNCYLFLDSMSAGINPISLNLFFSDYQQNVRISIQNIENLSDDRVHLIRLPQECDLNGYWLTVFQGNEINVFLIQYVSQEFRVE